jgi:cold shock CspA family protein
MEGQVWLPRGVGRQAANGVGGREREEGQRVEYELADNRGKSCAENLKVKTTP